MSGAFPGGPVVKTLPSNAGGTGSIPLGGTKIPQSLEPKHKTEQYCNKFKKFEGTLKMVHIQKKKKNIKKKVNVCYVYSFRVPRDHAFG